MAEVTKKFTKSVTAKRDDLILVIPKTMDSGDTIDITGDSFLMYFKNEKEMVKALKEQIAINKAAKSFFRW